MAKTGVNGLNADQLKAVKVDSGPALVVAGAGTGKTRVIVERIVRLIQEGADRGSIAALTFTEKAAQEMLDRVNEAIPSSYGTDMTITTFNAFGYDLLREFAPEIGLSGTLKLLGDTGKTVFLREHLDELDLDYFAPISRPDGQIKHLADYFSLLKQQLVTPNLYADFVTTLPVSTPEEKLEHKRHAELAGAFGKYLQLTRHSNFIDYDDQLYLVVEMLEARANVLKKLQQRYEYLLIDEFQDTNPMQSRLIDLLAGEQLYFCLWLGWVAVLLDALRALQVFDTLCFGQFYVVPQSEQMVPNIHTKPASGRHGIGESQYD